MSNSSVRTRFAPSPTGFLHIGGARTALFAWAYARHFGGTFILRIEDTDVERSTPEAVQAILDGMGWLDLAHDEGPFFQMQQMDRYHAVIAEMLAKGSAYHCYASPAELDAMREAQRARGDKPRYDGRWRPENAVGKTIPADVKPVVRFRNPVGGSVTWDDLCKGPITISNDELDDLIIARSDGTPTYNFCVCVDDWDMRITHVIRGDDHVNNTPRQINILAALGAAIPVYGHVPMIHGSDGEKLSKRHGAVSVTQYDDDGYLPEAVINYLARLGWSHGDDEVFSRAQLVEWFDGSHLSKSPAQFDHEKLKWLNGLYIKQMSDATLADLLLARRGRLKTAATAPVSRDQLTSICALFKDRAQTLNELDEGAQWVFGKPANLSDEARAQITPAVREMFTAFNARLLSVEWSREAISALIKEIVAANKIKMPQFAIPLRLAVFGRAQTPAIDAMLTLLSRDEVIKRLGTIAA
jgi:glutamyl-tRNA synthetase